MKYCVKCGSKINGKFCSNCGAKIEETPTQITPEMAAYLNNEMVASKQHNGYRLATGIVMIIVSSLVLFAALVLLSAKDGYEHSIIFDYDLVKSAFIFALALPGLCTLTGGILSIASRNNNNLLLTSGILYLVAALINLIAITDISILFILACTFGIINIVFYSKARQM